MTRFVFDTNVIVSALLFNDSVPGRAFIRALNRGTTLVSGSLVRELRRVLGRDRFDRYVSREERDEFLESLIRESDLIEITESVQACLDPEDDRVLELAVNGNATYIVTGDGGDETEEPKKAPHENPGRRGKSRTSNPPNPATTMSVHSPPSLN